MVPLTPQKHQWAWDYHEQLYANKMDNLEEMEKFLETYNLPRLNEEEIENIIRQITSNEIESVIKKPENIPTTESPGRWLHKWILPNI